ncbi:kelch-like protein 5 [Oppia nitens]|uniref:kelch-like protein 5 n=1 Tax=Oppia nitens TaxID=1686743 RepID=UPI0023DC75A8|nr:kelch-like protein 5 [Oppia nitens]
MKNAKSTNNQNNLLYICGGIDDGYGYQSNCYQYNQRTGVWLTIKSMSTVRANYGLVSYENQLYAIGGLIDTKTLNTVEKYNQQTNQWQSVASLKITSGFTGTAVLNDTIYVCGGFNDIDNYLNVCEYYSANIMDKWFTTTTHMLTNRSALELVAHSSSSSTGDGGYLYAIGGANDTGAQNIMERYDPVAKQWQPMANMQSSRYYFGSASFLGKIYVCGGLGSSDAGKTCESYEPKTNQWTPIASMNHQRYQFKLIVFNDILYAMGGGYPATDTIEIYDQVVNEWYNLMHLPVKLIGLGAAVITT